MTASNESQRAQNYQPGDDPLSRLKSRCEAVVYSALTDLGIGIRKDYADIHESLNSSVSKTKKRRP